MIFWLEWLCVHKRGNMRSNLYDKVIGEQGTKMLFIQKINKKFAIFQTNIYTGCFLNYVSPQIAG